MLEHLHFQKRLSVFLDALLNGAEELFHMSIVLFLLVSLVLASVHALFGTSPMNNAIGAAKELRWSDGLIWDGPKVGRDAFILCWLTVVRLLLLFLLLRVTCVIVFSW